MSEESPTVTTTTAGTAPAPASTTATTTAVRNTAGLCPVKPEYLRPAMPRVSLDADGKSKGMNKGAQREQTENVQGTERPTFEGEVNFVRGDNLHAIKNAIKAAKQRDRKRERTDDEKKKQEQEAATAHPPTTAESPSADAPPPPLAPTAQTEANKELAAVVTKAEEKKREDEEKYAFRRNMFRNKSFLAPLTTVGNLPFRRICKEYGVDVTLSEMAMVYNLNQVQKSEWSLLRRHESETLYGIQLGVGRPDDARIFAKALAAADFEYDYIDINCGCPVDLMVSRGCGCGLMQKRGRLRQVVEELVANQSKPVTIKCRLGEDDWTLANYIGDFEKWGASAVTVHGRTRRQRYTKAANWEYVEKCAQLTSLPVIGNGDVLSYDDVAQHRQQCPTVTSFMSGRGALKKPWLFQEVKEERTIDISSSERFDMLKKFCDYGLKHWGSDERGVLTTRRFLCEWLSFLCRYVPVALLETLPQRMNDRPPYFVGRDDLETLMASDSVTDWIRISELLLGPAGDKFKFTPKHKSNAYSVLADGSALGAAAGTGSRRAQQDEDEG